MYKAILLDSVLRTDGVLRQLWRVSEVQNRGQPDGALSAPGLFSPLGSQETDSPMLCVAEGFSTSSHGSGAGSCGLLVVLIRPRSCCRYVWTQEGP